MTEGDKPHMGLCRRCGMVCTRKFLESNNGLCTPCSKDPLQGKLPEWKNGKKPLKQIRIERMFEKNEGSEQ